MEKEEIVIAVGMSGRIVLLGPVGIKEEWGGVENCYLNWKPGAWLCKVAFDGKYKITKPKERKPLWKHEFY